MEDDIGGGQLSRSMLSDLAYDALHARIINLRLEPGRRLNIDKLSGELGVSPTPLREALGRLSAEDLVRVEPFKGFFVAPLLDQDELAYLADVRALLESHAVIQGAERFSTIIGDLRGEIDLMGRLVDADDLDVRAFNGADARFHTMLVAAAGNPTLDRTYRKLNAHAQIARLFIGRGEVDARQANDEHERIAAALVDGDLDKARTEVVDHINGVCERLSAPLKDGGA
ncbi:MAG: GntR family transcriptional regulator [Euzebyales bacterium]|nr:GntR family transcriptional regulator [Euzebyales bacterium]